MRNMCRRRRRLRLPSRPAPGGRDKPGHDSVEKCFHMPGTALPAFPAPQFGMFAPPLGAMLPVFSDEHTEVDAGALIARFACPVQAKHHFTNAFAVFPELLAALLKVSPQFVGNILGAGLRSANGRAENHHQSKQSISFHVEPPPSSIREAEKCHDFESKIRSCRETASLCSVARLSLFLMDFRSQSL